MEIQIKTQWLNPLISQKWIWNQTLGPGLITETHTFLLVEQTDISLIPVNKGKAI